MEPEIPTTVAAAASTVVREPRVPGGVPAVLLVDDDPPVLDVVGRYIARCGCRVLVAGTPSEALQLATATDRVDLLVSDVMMPVMSGPKLYECLAERIPGLRVIYISGYTGAALSVRDVMAHGALFLQKPFSAAQMKAKLCEALAGLPDSAPALP